MVDAEQFAAKQTNGRWLLTAFVYGLAIVLFLFYAVSASSRSLYDTNSELVTIERFNPVLTSIVGWGALAVAIGLLVISFISFRRRFLRLPVIGLMIVLILYPYSVLNHFFNNLGPWTIHGRVTSEDGTEYVFCDSSFLQGQIMAIAEVGSTTLFKTTYRVLVDNNGDWPRSWASLVRPANSRDDYGQLYLCKNNMLVGVRYNNRCFLAYDLANQIPVGHGKIETLSPFICLNDGDQPNKPDIERTIARIQEYAEFCATSEDVRPAEFFLKGDSVPGCPPLAAIQDGLGSDNVAVSSVAKTLLECYDDALAKVRSKVSTPGIQPDSATEQD